MALLEAGAGARRDRDLRSFLVWPRARRTSARAHARSAMAARVRRDPGIRMAACRREPARHEVLALAELRGAAQALQGARFESAEALQSRSRGLGESPLLRLVSARRQADDRAH